MARTTNIYDKLIRYLSRDKNFNGFEKICLIKGEMPKDVDQNWYLNHVLFPILKTVCSVNIVDTKSGEKMKI